MSKNDKVTAQARHKAVKGSSAGRGESSDDCGMWTEMVQMLRAVVDVPHMSSSGKALSPMVDRRIRRTTSDDDDAERRRRRVL